MLQMTIIENEKIKELKEVLHAYCQDNNEQQVFKITYDCERLLKEAHVSLDGGEICTYNPNKDTIQIYKMVKEI